MWRRVEVLWGVLPRTCSVAPLLLCCFAALRIGDKVRDGQGRCMEGGMLIGGDGCSWLRGLVGCWGRRSAHDCARAGI